MTDRRSQMQRRRQVLLDHPFGGSVILTLIVGLPIVGVLAVLMLVEDGSDAPWLALMGSTALAMYVAFVVVLRRERRG